MLWKRCRFITIYKNTFVLEGVPETYIQVDRIHGKSNRLEIFMENII